MTTDPDYGMVDGIRINLASKKFVEFDAEHTESLFKILKKGPKVWNQWREDHPDAFIDLRQVSLLGSGVSLPGVNLRNANLGGVHFGGVDLEGADLSAAYLHSATLQYAQLQDARLAGAYLSEADLNVAKLNRADLRLADLSWAGLMLATLDSANLTKANLSAAYIYSASFANATLVEADLSDAVLREAEFVGADLTNASLNGASLVETDFSGAKLNGCRVYGTSVWKPILDGTEQSNLIITPENEPVITIDNLKVAQFVYLLLENKELRDVIDTLSSKMVLILGRFTQDRKQVLDQIKTALRAHDLLPVIFDFDGPSNRDVQETVSTLAHMARFIVADLTDPKSIPQELISIVPGLPSVPVLPLIRKGERPWGMYEAITRYPWVLRLFEYENVEHVIRSIETKIIDPAEEYISAHKN